MRSRYLLLVHNGTTRRTVLRVKGDNVTKMMNKYRLLFSWQFILITLKIVMFFNSVIPSLGFCPKKIFLGMGENSYQEGIPPDVVYPHFHVMVIGRPWNRAQGLSSAKPGPAGNLQTGLGTGKGKKTKSASSEQNKLMRRNGSRC